MEALVARAGEAVKGRVVAPLVVVQVRLDQVAAGFSTVPAMVAVMAPETVPSWGGQMELEAAPWAAVVVVAVLAVVAVATGT
jgi:hypothetical protein